MTMPDGAQVSDDGQWWWDDGAQQWQPMAGGDAGTHEQPEPAFIFDTNGLFVGPDDTDNPDNHAVLHHDAGTQVSFLVWNVGQGTGPATVTIYVDDTEVQTWVSGDVAPNQSAAIDGDGFVHGCGRYPAGRHVFRARVTPGHPGGGDDTTNEVDID
jgi:hypothetical protein